LREGKRNETKIAEEYYWAITHHAVPEQVPRSWSLQLHVFQLESLVHTSKVDLPTLNSDLLKIRLAVDLSNVQ